MMIDKVLSVLGIFTAITVFVVSAILIVSVLFEVVKDAESVFTYKIDSATYR